MCLEFGNTTIVHFVPQSSFTVSLQPELPVQSTTTTSLLAQRSAKWKGWMNLGAMGRLTLGYCLGLFMPIGKAVDKTAVVVEDTAQGKETVNHGTTRERVRKAIGAGASIARNIYNKVTTVYDSNGNQSGNRR